MSRLLYRQFACFSGIGVINTVIHVVAVVLMVELYGINPVAANVAAFMLANLFSFWANARWTFRESYDTARYLRFLTISLLGLLTTALLSALANALGWHYLVGIALIMVTLPIITFLAHRKWTWPEDSRQEP